MVCDENSTDQRLPYNNIYSNGTRTSSSDTSSNENTDYSSSNIEIVESANNTGGSSYLQNGEPPQVESKRKVPKKVPTRYVLVVMGFLAFVNMYMMYLNITVAWPTMVNRNSTKHGALIEQTGIFFENSEIEKSIKKNITLLNSRPKISHRKESHEKRKRKRKIKPPLSSENLTDNSKIVKNTNTEIVEPEKYLQSTATLRAPNHSPNGSDKNLDYIKPPTNISKDVKYEQNNKTVSYEPKITEATDNPVQSSTIYLPQTEERDEKSELIKKPKRKRRSLSKTEQKTIKSKEHNRVQVISIVPKVVIKSLQRKNRTLVTTSPTTTVSEIEYPSTAEILTTESPEILRTESPIIMTTEFFEKTESTSSQNDVNTNKFEIPQSSISGRMINSKNFVVDQNTEINALLIPTDIATETFTIAATEVPNTMSPLIQIGLTETTAISIDETNADTKTESVSQSIPTTTETVTAQLIEKPKNKSLLDIKDFTETESDTTISPLLSETSINTTEQTNITTISTNFINEYNDTVFRAILPILRTKLPIISNTKDTIRNYPSNFHCLFNPKSCEFTILNDTRNYTKNSSKMEYNIKDSIPPPLQPPFTVRLKKYKGDDDDDESEEDSDEYKIKSVNFQFGNYNPFRKCTLSNETNCQNNMNLLSMSIFFDHSSSSSSSSSEEDDEEEDSEEEDDEDDDEDEGGEENDEEEENEDEENGEDIWEEDENLDNIQLEELYFDNSTDLFKRYDQNVTANEIDAEYLNRINSSNSKISTNWADKNHYVTKLCDASSEECDEVTEEEPTTAEKEARENDKKTEDNVPHRTEGLITLDNEKIPSTVCFYKKKASTTFDTYDDGEFSWNPEKINEVTSAYYWGLLVSQILAGRLTSQFGGKIILVQAILFAGVITLLTPLLASAGLYWLLTGRLFLGLMLGLVMPSMHALLAKWAPPLERTKMVAYTYSGIAIGAAIGGPLSAYIVQRIGWRLLFYGQGITAILWCVLFLLIIYESPNKHKRITQKEKQYILSAIGQQHAGKGLPVPWCSIIRCRHVFSLMLAQGAFVWGWHTLLHYAPFYITSVLHQDLHDVQKIWAAALCCMFVSSCAYATIADWARKSRKASTITVRRAANSICSLITAVFLVGVAQAYCNTEAVKVCFALAIAMGIPGALCGIFPNSLDLAPNHAAAIAGISGAFATTANLLAPYYWLLIVLGQSTLERWRTIWYTSAIFLLLANCLYFLLVGAREQRWNRPIVVTKQPRRGEETNAARRPAYAPYKNQAYVSTEHL